MSIVNIRSKRIRIALVGRVFIVYWLASPDADSVRASVADLPAARLTVGAPLFFCACVPEWVESPPPEVRRLIIDGTPAMLEFCESIHTIHAGDGLIATAFRTVARGMVLAGGFRGKVFIHGSLEEFLASKIDQLGAPASEVRRELDRLSAGSVLSAG